MGFVGPPYGRSIYEYLGYDECACIMSSILVHAILTNPRCLGSLGNAWQECQQLEAKCQEERGLGQEFAEEAQEWVKLTGKLSDRVNALTAETDQMSMLRKVG